MVWTSGGRCVVIRLFVRTSEWTKINNRTVKMATKQVLLKDLKVGDLKKELEERDMETSGRKAELQDRLRQALVEEGDDPDSFVFEVPGTVDLNVVLDQMKENSRSLKEEIKENSKNLEEKMEENSKNLEEKMKENSRSLKVQIEEQIKENSRHLEEKLEENSRVLEEKLEEKSRVLEGKLGKDLEVMRGHVKSLEDEMNDIRQQVAAIQASEKKPTSKSSTGSDLEKSNNQEIDVTKQTDAVRIQMKAPQFDGKSSWNNYHRQFEAAARANRWSHTEKALALTLALRGEATDILQTLNSQEQEDYDLLVKHLELRYGQTHLEHVYHSQLKNRNQRANESLQEFEADVARLVRLAYPATPENVMERLAVQAFLDGLRDHEMRQALILARPNKLVDALARALEFEAAKQSSRGTARVRSMDDSSIGGTIDEAALRRIFKELLSEKKQLRCWNCGKAGHIRSRCKEKTDHQAPPSASEN